MALPQGLQQPPTSINPQPAYLPTPAQGQATYYGGTTDPTQSMQLLLNAFQPAAQQQYQNAMDTAAFSGVQGGPLDTISRELAQAQTSALSPELANMLQFAQGQQQQAGLFNTNAANQFTQENLQNLLGQQQYNAGTYNQSLQNLMNMFANPYQQMQQYGSQLGLENAGQYQIPQFGGGLQGFAGSLGYGSPSGGYSPYQTTQQSAPPGAPQQNPY